MLLAMCHFFLLHHTAGNEEADDEHEPRHDDKDQSLVIFIIVDALVDQNECRYLADFFAKDLNSICPSHALTLDVIVKERVLHNGLSKDTCRDATN